MIPNARTISSTRAIGSSVSDWPACGRSCPRLVVSFAISLHPHGSASIEVGRAGEPRIGEERRERLIYGHLDVDLRRIRRAGAEAAGAGAATVRIGAAATAGARPIGAPAIPARGHREVAHIAQGIRGRLPHAGEVAGLDVVLSPVLHTCPRGVRGRDGRIVDPTKIEDADEEDEREREHEGELHECQTTTPLRVSVTVSHATSFGPHSASTTVLMERL